ncbi:transcription-repair coupling factor [Ahniella affigens]|uniref:Transcription-repair-coupling factor n=1 Tax=Ahniella affigens TaxID=2021234 RepID=A0A2P1PUB3_9GAMM|nr:transcription-repair coupling factor [Ahniella affigens]AVP98433.1 transcription-repair coupling factor [Ahniella affigens]
MQPKFLSLPLPAAGQQRAYVAVPGGSGLSLAIADTARQHEGLVLVVVADSHAAHQLEAELGLFAPADLPILHFPDWETLPYDVFSPHPDIVSARIESLYRLPGLKRGILVVPVQTLCQRLPPLSFVQGESLVLSVRQQLDLETERRRLDAAGYRHVPKVLEPGDYATRGALLDIYPSGSREPYRIELLDDEIDSIRTFDPETQRSREKVQNIRLLPAREFPLTAEATKAFRLRLADRFDIDLRRSPLYQDMREGAAPAGIEYYLPLFFEQMATLFDYLGVTPLIVCAHNVLQAADDNARQTEARYQSRRHDIERPVLAPAELFLSPEQLRSALNKHRRIELQPPESTGELIRMPLSTAPMLPIQRKHEDPAQDLKLFLRAYPGRVLIAADSAGRREALLDLLASFGIKPEVCGDWQQFRSGQQRFAMTVAPLDDGFSITEPAITVLTERQLYGERVSQSRRRKRAGRDPETIIRDLGELTIGAPIVHEDHGVGRYLGLITLDVGGEVGEFLAIEYAKGDKLYVPVANLHLVGRYTGSAPELAPLHTMGGEAWTKAKRRAAEKVRDAAAELLEIYAKREARGGTALTFERYLYEQFAAAFPFEETPDQLQAIEAVIADLVSPKAMDRVVCGDVGFGKTEVALRAAFCAAIGGKQVALLVPTTLLANQHYRNFSDRFADWPIRVEMLSRFKTKKETDAAIAKLAEGQIDIVIGTHKLLSSEIRYKDLGLVIIDEEQRFGVRHKEQFKKLRAEVDLLTLTATPIPRTLNMSMSGLRDLSIIGTPPAHRLAVQTFVTPWDQALLREACQRELARGGQIYFLHNEVENIEKMAATLTELVPEARIKIAHGQMPERELEQVMLDFYRQRFNILLATTIIESGIDVPSANTIIINRADRFGLAQLHQLRGRVGRSHHRAYAYLVTPERKAMTADAVKRLDAIASLDELGAGFTLATHDLEIRGAGELLGEDQSGQIQEVGFTLYTEMLERAVKALKSGKIIDLEAPPEQRVDVELRIAALIPSDYIDDVNTRLSLYKRIASAESADALRELQTEMIDRFGLLPDKTKNLFAIAGFKLAAQRLGIKKLDMDGKGGRILFRPKPPIDPLTIIKLIQAEPKTYALDGQDKLKVRKELPEPADRLGMAQHLLQRLAA